MTHGVINAGRHIWFVLPSLAGKDAELVWQRRRCPRLSMELQRAAYRKLLTLDAADDLGDLRVPPGNRLEKLSGDREGQHSVAVNQQWRVCFTWTAAGPTQVEIVEDH